MIRTIPLMPLLIALSSASCQKERDVEEPNHTPKEHPEKALVAQVSIASVSMLDDCPDLQDSEADSMAAGDSDEGFAGDSYGDAPCAQSSMQIAITGQGDSASKLSITAIRLLGPEGAMLGTIQPRMPMLWNAEGYYVAWDEMVMPKTDVKASYKISSPNWGEVQNKLGGSTYGPLFRLEADIKIDSVTKTVRSSEIVREQDEMIDT